MTERTLDPVKDFITYQATLPPGIGTLGYAKTKTLQWVMQKMGFHPNVMKWNESFSHHSRELFGKNHFVKVTNTSEGLAVSMCFSNGETDQLLELALRHHSTDRVSLKIRSNLIKGYLKEKDTLPPPDLIDFINNDPFLSLSNGDIRLSQKPLVVGQDIEAKELRNAINDIHRTMPIVVVARKCTDPDAPGQSLLNVQSLAQRLFGLAHVVDLPADQQSALAILLPSSDVVMNGGVRIFRTPTATVENGLWQCPLLIPNAILDIGKRETLDKLVIDLTRENRLGLASSSIPAGFDSVSDLLKLQEQAETCENSDVIALRTENRQLSEQLRETEQLLDKAQDENALLEEMMTEALDEKGEQIRVLQEALQEMTLNAGRPAIVEKPSEFQRTAREVMPPKAADNLRALSSWLETNHSDTLALDDSTKLPKALDPKALKSLCGAFNHLAIITHPEKLGWPKAATQVLTAIDATKYTVTNGSGGSYDIAPSRSTMNPEHELVISFRPDEKKDRLVITGIRNKIA